MAKYFEFQWAIVFCLGQHLSKQKTTRNARNLGAMPFGPPSYTYACGWPTWSLQATWCPWAPHWWPLIFGFFCFNIWFGMVQNQTTLIYVYKAEKLVKIYWLCRAEKDNHYILFNLFFFFSNPSNFIAVCFVWLKKVKVNCTSVLPLSFFTS